jgi:hypothetical protein
MIGQLCGEPLMSKHLDGSLRHFFKIASMGASSSRE